MGISPQALYYKSPLSTGFTEITGIPGTPAYPILSIATDPRHTERVWVGLGATNYASDLNTNRILYSPDAGITWYDVSYGLPPRIPVTRLEYQEGANILFCATDAGIYKCDMNAFYAGAAPYYTIQWDCFNQGALGSHDFPNALVTDLKINYCAGKIYASTYGRAVWESDLNNIFEIVDKGDTITTNTNWTSDKYITGGIVVNPGVTLKISSNTVHMPRNGLITVLPGGKLEVINSKITNDCKECLWFGIDALGMGSTYGQDNPANYGLVKMDNAIIEYARYGVNNCDMWNDYSQPGGVIQAKNSKFLNNHVSTWFASYHNDYASARHDNISYFDNCQFLIDNNYRGESWWYKFECHAYLTGVEGVKFRGCDFLNRYTYPSQLLAGDGIRSFDGGSFNLELSCPSGSMSYPPPACAGGFKRNYFSRLHNGIAISGAFSFGVPASIDQADFDSVSVGVNISKMNQVAITSCHFTVGNGAETTDLGGCYENIGVLIQNSQNFRMEGNTFTGNPHGSPWMNYGAAVVNSCGPLYGYTNDIYRNNFDHLNIGAYAVGCNRGAPGPGSIGLQISCNTFDNNGNDIRVVSSGSSGTQGIAPYQCSASIPSKSAGNKFTNYTTRFSNNCSSITYYYTPGLSPTEDPDPSITSACSAVPTALPADCLPTVSAGGGGLSGSLIKYNVGTLGTLTAAFLNSRQAYEDSTGIYKSLIDGGHTKKLLHLMDSLAEGDLGPEIIAGIINDGLPELSPWLSEAVLRKTLDIGVGLVPDSLILKALMLNPDLLKNYEFMQYVQEYTIDMDTTYGTHYTDSVIAAAALITPRTSLETSITSSAMICGELANHIMMAVTCSVNPEVSVSDSTGAGICTDTSNVYCTLDSNSVYGTLDLVDTAIKTLGEFWPQYDRVGYYYLTHQYDVADSVNTEITNSLSQDEIDLDYQKAWSVFMHAYNDKSRTLATLNEDDIADLDTTSVPVFSRFAGPLVIRNITVHYAIITYDIDYSHLVLPITCMGSTSPVGRNAGPSHWQKKRRINKSVDEVGKSIAFTAYPNPTSGVVNFIYNAPNAGGIEVTITNIMGEQVALLHVMDNAGKINWDASKLPAGIYLYQAKAGNGLVAKGKIVVAR